LLCSFFALLVAIGVVSPPPNLAGIAGWDEILPS
jgi:hypothetical protein